MQRVGDALESFADQPRSNHHTRPFAGNRQPRKGEDSQLSGFFHLCEPAILKPLACPNVSQTVCTHSGHLTCEPSSKSFVGRGCRTMQRMGEGRQNPVAFVGQYQLCSPPVPAAQFPPRRDGVLRSGNDWPHVSD